MKSINLMVASMAGFLLALSANGQTLNWQSLCDEQKHIVTLHAGTDYGMTIGAGYGYHLKAPLPIILNADFSMPSGQTIGDDFKSKAGVQIRVYEWKSLCFSAEVQGVFRRYESDYVRLLNFGSDLSGTLGFYRPHWFAAAQIGFDKAIVTHFKNSEIMQNDYPGIQNGWYQPSTGGIFYYGLQGGYSFSKADVYMKAGKVIEQDFRTSPLIPFYGQIGLSWKFSGASH
jgi:hypothetical protein